MAEPVRYTYRLRPGARAERALIAEWHRCRFLWNEAVNQHKTGRKPTLCKLSKMLTEARARTAWLREGCQCAQQQALRTYIAALQDSYRIKGRGKPLIKTRKRSLPSLQYTTRAFAIKNGRLRLPGILIPVVWSRQLPSDPTSVRVHRDTLGHWYASFVVRRSIELPPPVNGSIGIDWGVTTTATTTNAAYDLPYGGYRKRCAAELAKAQRSMSRRRCGRGSPPSKGYCRAKLLAAKFHKKALRQNKHAARLWARRIVDSHQTIAVEDFKPDFLTRSTMARKAADAAIGSAKRELIERGLRAGRKVVLVPPAYTTMTCSSCYAIAKQPLELGQRIFRCGHCSYTADRDRNAARVILAMAEPDYAGTDDIRRRSTPSGAILARSEPEISVATSATERG